MDPWEDRPATVDTLAHVYERAADYLGALDRLPAYNPGMRALVDRLGGPLPATGAGALAAVRQLLDVGTSAATHSGGSRFYHFVVGGSTPAAMAADWVASLLDQNAAGRGSSDFATEMETVVLGWLRELFGLPAAWGGVLVGSAMLANLTGLGCATHWWGEHHGVDTTEYGLTGLPPMPILSGGYLHSTTRKALQMLGHGRRAAEIFARDPQGRVDLAAMKRRLARIDGPAVLVATAGEVNTGDFDPIDALADLAHRYGSWLHVDAAFGIFASVSPRSAHLVVGIGRAHSVGADGHKWLNVPYDSGFAFVHDSSRLRAAFGVPEAPYLSDLARPEGGYASLAPESSRRARALPIWATLAAYGRSGYRAMVERHLDLAQHLAKRVDEAPDLERLAEVPLTVVCFRYRPAGWAEDRLDELNRRLGDAILADGRFLAGTTTYAGRVALRPALTNWRIGAADIDGFVAFVGELGARLTR